MLLPVNRGNRYSRIILYGALLPLLMRAGRLGMLDKRSSQQAFSTGAAPYSEAAYAPLLYASFFQNDSATVLPNADTGQVFTQYVGTWGTRKYRAYNASATVNGVAGAPCGVSDCTIRIICHDVGGANGQGQAFRISNNLNYWFVEGFNTAVRVGKVVAGAGSIPSSTPATLVEGDELKVVLSGSQITYFQNGVQLATFSDAFNSGATIHGVHNNAASTSVKHLYVDTNSQPSAGNVIRITSPARYQGFAQQTGSRSIPLTGTYTGVPSAVEARLVPTGSTTGIWYRMNITGAGTWGGNLTVPTDTQGLLEARFVNDRNCIDRHEYVGVASLVVAIAGQSNAQGRGTNRQFYTHATWRVGKYTDAAGGEHGWRECYDPIDSSSPSLGSPWPRLMTQVLAAENKPMYVVMIALGSTGLTALGGGQWAATVGNKYIDMKNALINSGVGQGNVRKMWWYQGENDAVSTQTQAAYETALKAMLSQFETDWGIPAGNLDLFTVSLAEDGNPPNASTRGGLDAVRLAQIDGALQSNIKIGPMLYDIILSDASLIHLISDAELTTFANRAAHMYKFHYTGAAPGRGPRFLAATKTGASQIDVQFTMSNGTSIQVGASPLVGWLVQDDLTNPNAVLTCVVQAADTLRLTVTVPLSTNPKISFASFNDAVGGTITDNSADVMPAEPFILQTVV